ncbi:hypothetical protein BDY24DRAFT_89208 [Mrakia frigida]|uniref:uncharacterized protein n=1 Tax=Mrakia frigida TaxID=29902 RepID=UPI003FCBFF87
MREENADSLRRVWSWFSCLLNEQEREASHFRTIDFYRLVPKLERAQGCQKQKQKCKKVWSETWHNIVKSKVSSKVSDRFDLWFFAKKLPLTISFGYLALKQCWKGRRIEDLRAQGSFLNSSRSIASICYFPPFHSHYSPTPFLCFHIPPYASFELWQTSNPPPRSSPSSNECSRPSTTLTPSRSLRSRDSAITA